MALDRYISNLDDGSGEEDVYPGRIVDLGTLKEALGRHRLFWVACALLGLVCGATFHLVIPAKYVAVTTLYLTEPAGAGTYTVADDVNLLETTTVADQALKDFDAGTKNRVPGNYEGVALGNVLLEIKADGSTRVGAVRWAEALAKGFFSVRARTLGGQTRLVVSSLQAQVTQLETSVQRLNHAIDVLSSSTATSSTSNQVSDMVSERGTDESQLTTLQNEMQSDLIEERAVNTGSYVLDPAEAKPVDTKKIFAEDGLAGLVAGLAIGIGMVVVGAAISDRPRRRTEIATLLGAPVELSLHGVAEPGWRTGASTRGYLKRPGIQLQLAERRLRERLGGLRRPALALVSTGEGAGGTAAVLLASTALSLVKEGKRVALVDMAQERPLARLFRTRAKDGAVQTIAFRGQQLRLAVAAEDMTALDSQEVARGADAVLVLANANPAVGAQHLEPWADASVVVVRVGKASDVLIEATGQMLRDAGVPPVSAILLGADQGDDTFGARDGARTVPDAPMVPRAEAPSSRMTSLQG